MGEETRRLVRESVSDYGKENVPYGYEVGDFGRRTGQGVDQGTVHRGNKKKISTPLSPSLSLSLDNFGVSKWDLKLLLPTYLETRSTHQSPCSESERHDSGVDTLPHG